MLQRQAGDITKHNYEVLHAVTRLTSGTRYGLFVVDRANGLGETGIIEADLQLVRTVLAIMEHETAVASPATLVVTPFSTITFGEEIGSGHFKIVCAGTWTARSNPSLCITTTRETGPGFVPELTILRAINQQANLVHFYGYSLHLNKCYLIGERAPFGNLREHLVRVEESGGGPLKPTIALEIAIQSCQAMQQLNSLGVLHRTLTSKNLLVFTISHRSHREVKVKISDFGLPNHPSTAIRGENETFPVRWLAPEVLLRRLYSEKADVWSLGVLMWEVFSMAMVPYYEIFTDKQVIRAVVEGTRLAAPVGCPLAVFEHCLQPCWATTTSERPSLQTLRTAQETLLAEQATDTDQRLCCTCLSRPSSHALVPCGHLCLCNHADCTAPFGLPHEVDTARRACPICRCDVKSLLDTLAQK